MRTLPFEQFLASISAHGMGVDPSHAPRDLRFLSATVEPRYWVTPKGTRDTEVYLETLIACLGGFETLYVSTKSTGGWLRELANESPLCRAVLRDLGPDASSPHVLAFDASELDAPKLLMLCSAAFGWSWPSDMYVLTDIGDVILMVDHHDCVWATFRDQARCDQFVEAMRAEQYELPTEAPDWTFREMSWMRKPAAPDEQP